MHPMLNIAFSAARSAGNLMLRYCDRLDEVRIQNKDTNDVVSEIDTRAEQIIVETIRTAFPDHGILTEESGQVAHCDEYCWIIDPLDGTKNYCHGFPSFAVSIALQHKGKTQHGLVYDPLRGELFTATRGEGARLNNTRIRVSSRSEFGEMLIGTGFPFRQHNLIEPYMKVFNKVLLGASDMRRAGAAALDLAYVACGRLDGFFEFRLNPWDIAAGSLIVKEAGGFTSDIFGTENYLTSGSMIAGNKKSHLALLKIIAPYAATIAEN